MKSEFKKPGLPLAMFVIFPNAKNLISLDEF